VIADWNKTGNLGLGIQTGAPLGIAIEAGNDDGTFDAAGTAADPRFIFLPEQFVSADLNGDGLPDLVALVIDVVNGGTVSVFLNAGPSPPLDFVSVSAASAITAVAPSSIASIYAPFPFSVTQSNKSPSAPIQLAGVSVDVKDSACVTRPAPLFYVSPTQVNLEIPSGTAPGVAAITVASGGPPVVGSALVQNVVPAIFTVPPSVFPQLTRLPTDPTTNPGPRWPCARVCRTPRTVRGSRPDQSRDHESPRSGVVLLGRPILPDAERGWCCFERDIVPGRIEARLKVGLEYGGGRGFMRGTAANSEES